VVASDTKLPKFNRMLEAVMGWDGYHLHMFEVGGLRFGPPDEDDEAMIAERNITLAQILPRPGSSLSWTYDFGDNWTHEVVAESIEEIQPGTRYPVCTAGERACPPEDCGGAWGYEELLAALADPSHEEHESMVEWAPAGFDPATFDLEAANRRLRAIR